MPLNPANMFSFSSFESVELKKRNDTFWEIEYILLPAHFLEIAECCKTLREVLFLNYPLIFDSDIRQSRRSVVLLYFLIYGGTVCHTKKLFVLF